VNLIPLRSEKGIKLKVDDDEDGDNGVYVFERKLVEIDEGSIQ